MKSAVEARGIKYLVHFTRVENLSSIFKNGLLPVNFLNAKGMDYQFNDQFRYDNCKDANCLSIQLPNYRMFSKYRFQDKSVDWVVLGIRPEVLWEKDCVFCVENAASSSERSKSLKERKGIEAFNSLYDEYPGKPTRKQLGLSDPYPTHPQAEVLAFGLIEPKYIGGIAFKDELTRKKYDFLVPSNIKVEVVERLFSYRSDYEVWR
ncbi:hypothetical protein COF47_17350 [Bacillus wiedmannii]|uniref:DarT ssDNA thymidine ADP-ribosyltransferase family protein n=1 Tax=Bacillus wiedmannii TaxID=1890302 RepID=UPI000BFD9044|nr:DarT ssDNA thymidine ADP-ribosyltransferase family protein [Bacillus wiedmannii]PHE75169.1 hypothetical protein COF47_17350 [Bacillus wiedmannii]